MKSKTKHTKRSGVFDSNKNIFYQVSLFFFIAFLFINRFRDDLTQKVTDGGIFECWKTAIQMYSTWSSRWLVNFVLYVFASIDSNVPWALFVSISIYTLMYSLSELFVRDHKKECNVAIACMVMLFPYSILCSAGWISTMATYFCPSAFGFLSLVPIKRFAYCEESKWWEYILYTVALIYGCNNEQMLIVILGCYLVAVVYFAIQRKFPVYVFVQFVIASVCLISFLTCPGNKNREVAEQFMNYKTWGMFNFIDKMDLGYFTTMQWVFLQFHAFAAVACVIFTYLLWKKYKNKLMVVFSMLPALVGVLFGLLKKAVLGIFPGLAFIAEPIDEKGLVNVVNRGGFHAFTKYALFAVLITVVIVQLVLLQNNVRMLLISFTLMGAGALTRIAMGLSPSIFESRDRTFSVLVFCIIAVTSMLYSKYLEKGYVSEKSRNYVSYAFYMGCFFAIVFISLVIYSVNASVS